MKLPKLMLQLACLMSFFLMKATTKALGTSIMEWVEKTWKLT